MKKRKGANKLRGRSKTILFVTGKDQSEPISTLGVPVRIENSIMRQGLQGYYFIEGKWDLNERDATIADLMPHLINRDCMEWSNFGLIAYETVISKLVEHGYMR